MTHFSPISLWEKETKRAVERYPQSASPTSPQQTDEEKVQVRWHAGDSECVTECVTLLSPPHRVRHPRPWSMARTGRPAARLPSRTRPLPEIGMPTELVRRPLAPAHPASAPPLTASSRPRNSPSGPARSTLRPRPRSERPTTGATAPAAWQRGPTRGRPWRPCRPAAADSEPDGDTGPSPQQCRPPSPRRTRERPAGRPAAQHCSIR